MTQEPMTTPGYETSIWQAPRLRVVAKYASGRRGAPESMEVEINDDLTPALIEAAVAAVVNTPGAGAVSSASVNLHGPVLGGGPVITGGPSVGAASHLQDLSALEAARMRDGGQRA